MIDKLGALSQAVLRLQQTRGLTPQDPKAGTSPSPAAQRTDASPPKHATGRAPLKDRVMQRLAAVDPDHPKRRQRALRAFIEVKLLETFGDPLANDAGFQQLVDDVSTMMWSDESLQDDIQEAVDLLLK